MLVRRLMIASMILIAAVSNAGCSYDLSRGGAGGCPPLVEYSAEDQNAAANAIRANPNGSLAKMVRDYGVLRKACRVE
jgi:hypothetical protein